MDFPPDLCNRLDASELALLHSAINQYAACKTVNAKIRALLHFAKLGPRIESTLLSSFKSVGELVKWLESFSPGSKKPWAKDEDRFANNSYVENPLAKLGPHLSMQRVTESDSDDEDSTIVMADNTAGSEYVLGQSDGPQATTEPTGVGQCDDEKKDDILCGVGGPLHTAEGNAQEPFTCNVNPLAGSSGFEQGSGIAIPQIGAPSEVCHIGDKIKLRCLTECAGRDCRDLNLHRGDYQAICRWAFGSMIPFSIDYASFGDAGRTLEDATYALECLQIALAMYSSHNIGVEFKFVEPNTSPIVFQLKYSSLAVPVGAFAKSFFPVDTEGGRQQELYIFDIAFDTKFRGHMTNIFLHETAHILGGRHIDALTAEQDIPAVQMDPPNDMSVLVTDCDPSAIELHALDVYWFYEFMRLPNGHKIDGFPIRDITL